MILCYSKKNKWFNFNSSDRASMLLYINMLFFSFIKSKGKEN